jgi:hypothetical protein
MRLSKGLFEGVYKIDHLDINVRALTKNEAKGTWGMWNHVNFEILVDPEVPPWKQVDTFFHEVLHAYLRLRNVVDRSKESEENMINEESVVTALGSIMATFLRDNPQVLEIIRKIK